VTPRELARLLPLLVLYVALLFLLPAHPDDEASYRALAVRLTQGTYVNGDEDALLDDDPSAPDLWFGPGLPMLLAPLAAVDAPLEVMRVTGPVLLFAAMVLFYVVVRSRLGRSTAVVATYVIGLYPPFWPLLTNLHSELLAVFFVVLAMLGISRVVVTGRVGDAAIATAGLAGLALTRVAYGWVLTASLLVYAAAWLVRRRPSTGRLAAITAVALLACGPWLAYTYAKTGRPLVWGTSGPLSLYWMASPYPGNRGDWRQASDVFRDPALVRHRAFFEQLRGLSLADQNAEITREAARNIVDHPVVYIENIASNAARLTVNWPYSDERWQPNDLLYAVSNVVLVAGVVFAVVVLVPRRRALPPETGPFALIAGLGVGLHLLLAAYPRMLVPLVPLLGWVVLLAAVETRAVRSKARRRGTEAPSPSS
jgi:4-amino-4-deoxy-L-arabinose transferase-like glycosyltransferase